MYKNKTKENILIVVILLVASALILVGITHDLPYSYYPDEEHFVNRAISFGSGDLNPHWFHKPAFLMYLLFFEYGLYYAFGYVFGVFGSIDDFAIHFFQDKTVFLFLGRLTVALFGIGTIYITYLIGRNLFNKTTGLISAFLLSFVFAFVQSSQVVKADIPATFFTMVAFLFICKVYQGGETRNYILSGVFAGIGMGTKYYSGLLLPMFLLSHVLYLINSDLSLIKHIVNTKIMVTFFSFFLAFFIVSPFNILDPKGLEQTVGPANFVLKRLVHDLSGSAGKEKRIDTDVNKKDDKEEQIKAHKRHRHVPKAAYENLRMLLSAKGMSIIGFLSLLGIVYSLFVFSSTTLMLIFFPISFMLLASYYMPFVLENRHFASTYPFMTLLAGSFMYSFVTRRLCLKKINKNQMIILLCGLVVLVPGFNIIRHNYMISHKDTRTLAKEWVESNVPAGTKMLLEEGTVKLNPDKKYYLEMLNRAEDCEPGQFTTHSNKLYNYSLKALPDITYDIAFLRFPWWQRKEIKPGVYFATSDHDRDMGNPLKPVGVMPFEFYKQNGYQYVITTSEKYMMFKEGSLQARKFPSFYEFYKTLFREGTLVEKFIPHPWKRRGPIVKIFKIE